MNAEGGGLGEIEFAINLNVGHADDVRSSAQHRETADRWVMGIAGVNWNAGASIRLPMPTWSPSRTSTGCSRLGR